VLSRLRSSASGARSARPVPWRSAVRIAVAVALLHLLIGFTLGWTASPRRPPPPAAFPPAAPRTNTPVVGPTRMAARVPVGYAPTRESAARAALNYLLATAQPWWLQEPQARHAAITAIAAPAARAQLQADHDRVIALVLGNQFGQRLGDPDVRSVLRTAVAGYQVTRYDAERAEVTLWSVTVFGNTADLAPQAAWSTTTIDLRWAGDWKLAGTSHQPGPTPLQAQAPTVAAELIGSLERLHEVQGDTP
jgi:hypothetical protein